MPIGSFCLSNSASLNVYEIIYGVDDKIVVGINDLKKSTLKLYWNNKGGYFVFGRRRFYVGEAMKCT